jgi:uncharacterized protein
MPVRSVRTGIFLVMQVVADPRQVGKTTLVRQTLAALAPTIAQHSVSADNPGLVGVTWLRTQWETARGLTKSMAGRFEMTRLGHWHFNEMREAFGLTLDQFIYYGGYPGAATLIGDETRWAAYVRDALIETTISKDVLLLTPVQKPALLRRVFDLACRYSGQELSYQKMRGQLSDAGNTTTLAHYLELLEGAGMVCGLQKYAGQAVRQRASSPKLQVFNTALMGAIAASEGFGFERT